MGYSSTSEFNTADIAKVGDASNVNAVFQGALNNLRTEAAAGLNNAGMVRNLFGTSEAAGAQNSLDSMLGKVTLVGSGSNSDLAADLGDQPGARSLTGNSPMSNNIANTADNVDTTAVDTGNTGNLGLLMQMRGLLDQVRGPNKDFALSQVNKAITDLQTREATKALANSLGDTGNPDSLAKNYASPQAYRDYLATLQPTTT